MRILHVIPGLTHERGGPPAVLQALVRHQVLAGHQVAVLATDQGARRGEQPVELGIPLERLRVKGPDRLAYTPQMAETARRALRKCDLVHVHSIFTYPVHVTLREAVKAGVPVLLRPCGHLHRYSLRRSAWRKWAYLSVWGGMVRRAVRAWHYTSANESAESWPWDASPRFILPNGIEPEAYALDRASARATVQRTWPRLGDAPYVLFLARLHPKKRLDLLLEAFRAGAPAEFKLVVAGADECGLWEQLAGRFLNDAAVAHRVVRVGMVSGAEKIALLAAASLFALPSEHENFGIAALEALAAGTPVLLSPHVDLTDAVLAAGLGSSAPLELEAWRVQLQTALAPTGGCARTAARARRWVAEHFSWSRIATDLTERYRWVVAGCPAAGPVS